MLLDYIHRALRRAVYEKLADDGTYVGEVPGLQGVLANAPTLEACRELLAEVIEDWVLFRIAHAMAIPPIDGATVSISQAS